MRSPTPRRSRPSNALIAAMSLRPDPGATLTIGLDRQTYSDESNADADRWPSIGRFQIIAQIGRGSFGTVYKAYDTELRRLVAVKVPRGGELGSSTDQQRFWREARSASQLRHPTIVPTFDMGECEGTPYIVGELVEGSSLDKLISSRRFSFRDAAEIVASTADGLHCAHEVGIVHRDVKPSNIMIDAEGRPRIMDFGLARQAQLDATLTGNDQVLGTPAYMSPEQASGQSHKVDRRSDIYSLGIVLYELLTGERPFRGQQQMVIQQVVHDDPRNPRSLNDCVPIDLETICLKAIDKDPDRRYQTAEELANELAAGSDRSPSAAADRSIQPRLPLVPPQPLPGGDDRTGRAVPGLCRRGYDRRLLLDLKSPREGTQGPGGAATERRGGAPLIRPVLHDGQR